MKALWGLLLLGVCSVGWANVNVYLSSAAPPSTQSTFISNTLSLCTTTYFAPNTFHNSFDMIISSCAVGGGVGTIPEPDYVYGWANGATYNQYQQLQYLATLIAPCISGSTTTFTVAGSSTVYDVNINTTTCTSVVTTIQQAIWCILDSTPTIIPGGF